MKEKSAIISLLLLAFTLTSCVRDGENLDDCIRRMRIELRWIETQPLDDNETVHIEIIPSFDQSESEISSDIYGVDVDLVVGNYSLVGWETPQNVNLDIENQIVSIESSSDGIAIEPDLFNAGSTTTTVDLSERSLIIPLPMYRQVRPLIIEVNFTGAGISLVEGMTGMLTGIATERALANSFPPVSNLDRPAALKNGRINYLFALTQHEGAGIWYTGRRNLLGIDGNITQNLSLDINYSDGGVPVGRATSQLSFDLTEQLAGFHTKNVSEPWYVVLTINLGINLEADIVDWIAGPESWFIAH